MGRALLVLNGPADRHKAINWINKAPVGTRVEFKASRRSLPQNDRMWAMLTDVAAHMKKNGRDLDTETWKLLFMDAMGREVRFVPGLDGKSVVPIGQSSSDLSKEEMTDLIEFIFAWGAENGVTFNEPRETEPSEEASPRPASDAGSGGSASAAASTPSVQESGEPAGEPAGEADHGDAAADSPADTVTVELMRECIDNMLREAFSEPKDEQAAKVEKLRQVWLEPQNLGGHAEFVERCAKTATRVAGNASEKARAREYLMGYAR